MAVCAEPVLNFHDVAKVQLRSRAPSLNHGTLCGSPPAMAPQSAAVTLRYAPLLITV